MRLKSQLTGPARGADRTPPRGVPTLLLVLATFSIPVQAGHAGPTNKPAEFTSIDYYPAPNQMQMKSRMDGVDVVTLDNGQ